MKIGDIVRLNDVGLVNIGGLKSLRQIKAAQEMTITKLGTESLVTDAEVFEIEVDEPLINQFVLTTHDVELL